MSRQKLKWWCTAQGRSVALGCVAAGGLAAVSSQWLPHTMLQDYVLEGLRLYRSGKPVAMSQSLTETYENCLHILKLDERTKMFLEPYMIYGYDLYTCGSTKTKYGSHIGIPRYFEYNSHNDIEENLKVKGKLVDWSSDAGTRLADTLVLTEKEKMFGLCREIISAQQFKNHFFCVYPAIATAFAYGASSSINAKFNNYHRPRIVRVIIYSLVGCFSLGLFFLLKDTTQFRYERSVDEELGALGKDFVESGASFYDKMSKRNVALQELEGTESEMRFSRLGNENFLFRQRSTPILTRREYFKSMLGTEAEEI